MKKLILGSLALILIALSCEDSESGCIDVLSDNFNVNAVTMCDSCCTYPSANQSFRIYYDSISIKFVTDTLFINGDDTLILHDFKLLTSNYSFLGSTQEYQIRDSIFVNDISVRDDFIYIDRLGSYTVGDIRFEDEVSQVNFKLGIDENQFNAYKPLSQINQSSNLDESMDSMYNNITDKVAYLKMDIQLKDSIRHIELYETQDLLSFDYNYDVVRGFGLSYNLRLNLNILLEGVFSSNTNEEIMTTLNENIVESINLE